MNIYSRRKPKNGVRYGLGFKSKYQLYKLCIWKEYWSGGEVIHADLLFKIS